MQQYLPFTVLKPIRILFRQPKFGSLVATVLTVYGIETYSAATKRDQAKIIVATVLTVYGIET